MVRFHTGDHCRQPLESRNGFLVSVLFFLNDTLETNSKRDLRQDPLATSWKLNVGLCRHCLGDLLQILAANLVRIFMRILAADFPTACANVWCECLVRFLAEATKPLNRTL